MNQPRKRGRPAKVKPDAEQAQAQAETRDEAKAETRLKVLKADTIHDGEGGFLPVGALFVAADPEGLKARGLAE